jgi:hypothetical protein
VFGEVAELYDQARPSYPAVLFDDVIAFAPQSPRVLEVGAGTGKATVLLAERGLESSPWNRASRWPQSQSCHLKRLMLPKANFIMRRYLRRPVRAGLASFAAYARK